ncbi:hypothetical protein FACS1894211_10880 [Clostridia bacterium]|nr:hypothetical protein FACS1894211_10880 [Clostridia bacterium]
MQNGILIGMAIGALIGAAFVEGNAPASEMVAKSKKAIQKGAGAVADGISDCVRKKTKTAE